MNIMMKKKKTQEDKDNETNSALSLISEKEKWIERKKDQETPNKTTAASMFLEDAPLEELSTTIKTLMKNVVDIALFKQVKFYWSPQELNHVMGYVFYRIRQNGKDVHDRLEWTRRLWAAGCDFISTQTCELKQHLYDQWYAIGYGSVFFFQ